MQLTSEIIAGTLTIVGMIAFTLSRLGLVRFGKDKKLTDTCPAHKDLIVALAEIKAQQMNNVKLLDRGATQFGEIQKSLDYCNRAIAILLDRSGGIPKGLRNDELV